MRFKKDVIRAGNNRECVKNAKKRRYYPQITQMKNASDQTSACKICVICEIYGYFRFDFFAVHSPTGSLRF